jgi:hypothetical protein
VTSVHGGDLNPRFSSGVLFLFHKVQAFTLPESNTTRKRILGNNGSKPMEFRQFTGAEFARLSSSMQLMLLSIRQAQLSSRKAIAPAAERKRRRDDF